MTTRVLLVEDHAAFRQALAFMVDRELDMTIVGQAGSLAEARTMLEGVDVAVLDINLSDGNGVDLVQDLRAVNPHGSVLILTASADRSVEARAVEAGASGIMHKSAPLGEIIHGVRRLAAGEQLVTPREAIDLLRLASREREQDREAQAALDRLTPREMDVLRSLAEGLSDKEIAERLHVSTETVRTHMVNILGKLGVDSRLQALIFAIRHGAVEIA